MRPEAQILEFIDDIGFLQNKDWFLGRQALVHDLGLDEVSIEASVGVLRIEPVCFDGPRFDRDIQGIDPHLAVVIGVQDEQERLLDLVAWPLDRPSAMATLLGCAAMIGGPQVLALGGLLSPPLPVFRTALAWLRAGCVGCVPLDRLRSATVFLDAGGQILAEDDAHGVELDDARQEIIARGTKIMVAAA